MFNMKVAVFSDIHGNKYAFDEALKSMHTYKADSYIYCGDICGYYYHQNYILDRLREMSKLYCVLGNHDKMFLDVFQGKLSGDTYKEKYGNSVEMLKETISSENLGFLSSLKNKIDLMFDGFKVGVFHGTPWGNLNEYCYPDAEFNRYKTLNYDYIFQGHTHYRMHEKVGKVNVVNPGSIGQPRDGNPPSYILFDTIDNKIEFISVPYDIKMLANEVEKNVNEPSYLIEVLKRSAYNE